MVAEDAHQAVDLPEAEQLLAFEELEVLAVDLLRHAVGAAEIASVGDGDAQVPEGTVAGVEQGRRHGGFLYGRCQGRDCPAL